MGAGSGEGVRVGTTLEFVFLVFIFFWRGNGNKVNRVGIFMDRDCTQPKNEEKTECRTVYVVQMKEVISRDYYVIANSKAEALETFENEDYTDHEWDFHRGWNEEKVCLIDGSHCYHRSMKPTIEGKEEQYLNDYDWEAVEDAN